MSELRSVRLQRLPVALATAAQQHSDELLREFALIAGGRASGESDGELPERLVTLMEQLRHRYSSVAEERDAQLFAALDAGEEHIDVEMLLPPEAAAAAQAVEAMLEEADRFCSGGDHLLTLATPQPLVAFRQWYLGQVMDQLAGAAPTPWTTLGDPSPAD